ncbi:glycosyltransferase family 2 protein [Luteimonas salinilitoris]|uniref:Glycosyltransferase family 2 protein n=1 Tax=Luteimonas salinilitoris TaxID=3237697 RepID=A0ABV4HNC9_9GAMM
MTHRSENTAGTATPSELVAEKALPRVAVVIPSYRVRSALLGVIDRIPSLVEQIHVVDDACPEGSGRHVQTHCTDPRVSVHFNAKNLGVGGATIEGYRAAMASGADIVIKMDGDGQMDAKALPQLIGPIVRGQADYTKGNRFYDLTQIGRMPWLRILGNAVLSFMTKLSSGYWDLFDPTNGYTAIHTRVLAGLPLEKLSRRYFFETDMLFRLNIIRAVVADVPMEARYGTETSNLRISRVLLDFGFKHVRNCCKRLFYNYFLRDMSLASVELLFGAVFLGLGFAMGLWFWVESARTGITASAGSVTLVALQIIVGLQLILGFLAYDIASVPRRVLHQLLPWQAPESGRESR